MNTKRVLLFLVLSIVTLSQIQAQYHLLSLPTMTFGDEQYYYYEVKNKETLYGVARYLGITEEDILKTNPSASAGITKKQLLFFPVNTYQSSYSLPSQITIPEGNSPIIHTIRPGENICSIAKTYNTSVEGLINANVGLSPSDYKEGEQIRVIPNSAMPFKYLRTGMRFYRHNVGENETIETIALFYGTTPEDITKANSGLKKVRKGREITVPQPYSEQLMGDMRTVPLSDLQRSYTPDVLDNIYNQIAVNKTEGEINIGIILPFQLNKEEPPKQAFLYTDFYKGFMIALDSIQKHNDRPVNIKVYDTENNLNVTDSLLTLPEMKTLDIIIAPSEPKQMERIHNFGRTNNIKVFNCFDTKSNDYMNNPYIYQVNIPTKDLINNLLKWFDKKYEGCSVIFLEDPECESKEMFSEIKSHILLKNMPTTTLSTGGELSYKTLSNHLNPGISYVIIPSSSDKAVFKKAAAALKKAKVERFDCEFSLLVYPEYVLYLKECQNDMQTLDTYMFSRFFNAKGRLTRQFNAAYEKMFGGTTLLSYPNMGLLGFDTAMFIINTMNEGKDIGDPSLPTHQGIQTSFRFERENNWSGYVNQAIDMVHFTTDHDIITEVQ